MRIWYEEKEYDRSNIAPSDYYPHEISFAIVGIILFSSAIVSDNKSKLWKYSNKYYIHRNK